MQKPAGYTANFSAQASRDREKKYETNEAAALWFVGRNDCDGIVRADKTKHRFHFG